LKGQRWGANSVSDLWELGERKENKKAETNKDSYRRDRCLKKRIRKEGGFVYNTTRTVHGDVDSVSDL
jgi:hypothetical protein